MKKITFDEEEQFVIAVFDEKSRKKAVTDMELVLPELAEDPEMHALLVSTMEKLKRISDEEYAKLDLESYRADLEDDGADDTFEDDDEKDEEKVPAAVHGPDTSEIPTGGTDK